jgi:hypothetical protein
MCVLQSHSWINRCHDLVTLTQAKGEGLTSDDWQLIDLDIN